MVSCVERNSKLDVVLLVLNTNSEIGCTPACMQLLTINVYYSVLLCADAAVAGVKLCMTIMPIMMILGMFSIQPCLYFFEAKVGN
jgi:hypothetical protein